MEYMLGKALCSTRKRLVDGLRIKTSPEGAQLLALVFIPGRLCRWIILVVTGDCRVALRLPLDFAWGPLRTPRNDNIHLQPSNLQLETLELVSPTLPLHIRHTLENNLRLRRT